MGGGKSKKSTTSSGTPKWARPYVMKAADDAQNLYDAGALSRVAGYNSDQLRAAQLTRDLSGHASSYGRHADRLTSAANTRNANANRLARAADIIARDAGKDPAFAQAQRVYRDASEQSGIFGAGHYGTVAGQLQPQIDNQVTRALGQQSGQFSQSGNLGGARAQAAAGMAAGQISSDMSAAEVAAQRANAFTGAGSGVDTANTQFSQRVAGHGLQTNAFNSQGEAFNNMNTAVGHQGNVFQARSQAAQQLGAVGQDRQNQQQAELDAQYQGIQRMFGLINTNTVGSTSETTSSGGK